MSHKQNCRRKDSSPTEASSLSRTPLTRESFKCKQNRSANPISVEVKVEVDIAFGVKDCETAFELAQITEDETKFSYLIANIDSETLVYISYIVLNPPATDKFVALNKRLISEFQDSETQQIKKLLSDLHLGDKKPSCLLRQLRDLSLNKVTEDFRKYLWMQRLPVNVQAILSASTESLIQLAQLADKICEVSPDSQSIVCATSNKKKKNQSNGALTVLTKQIEALTVQVDRLTRERHKQTFSNQRNRSRNKSRTFTPKHNENPSYCFYHNTFQKKASKCVPPCNFNSEN
ncbi:uncharacterized protein NPIL_639201 [Nephila pilipes]|uniref:DUF7041 domain-containing protein n=1 Tax=Nephila pilipes TaxID=299642 RepID=A0A8X6NZ93_NEPPI|nr:uncharacterized protein NPIL_639201 [Nephila pilipes]